MLVSLMFADRHLARYLTAAARANEWQCTLSTCRRVWEHTCIHTIESNTYTYVPSPEDRTRRVELHAAAPLVLLASILVTIAWTPLETPPLARALRPPAGDTVCKQRKNATRLFSPAIRIAVGQRWRSRLAIEKVMKRDECP